MSSPATSFVDKALEQIRQLRRAHPEQSDSDFVKRNSGRFKEILDRSVSDAAQFVSKQASDPAQRKVLLRAALTEQRHYWQQIIIRNVMTDQIAAALAAHGRDRVDERLKALQ